MQIHSRATIDEFLALKRIAFVGVSRNKDDFSRYLFSELAVRGYDLVPVNPNAAEIEQRRCYKSIVEIQPPVEGALILTSSSEVDHVLADCATAHVSRIWLYRAAGRGTVTDSALDFCWNHGMTVIAGECPFMFLPQTQWFHRVHGFVRKISGNYPK